MEGYKSPEELPELSWKVFNNGEFIFESEPVKSTEEAYFKYLTDCEAKGIQPLDIEDLNFSSIKDDIKKAA